MALLRARFETPVGPMMALASSTALCALEFSQTGRLSRLAARLRRWYDDPAIEDGNNSVLSATGAWLNDYFAGATAETSGLQLDMRGAPFEIAVWTALRQIPPGTTTSYGAIARQLHSPGASRAVGMANGANPIAIIVPCHRVIGANGTLTGYGGGLERKTWLIEHERRWSSELRLPL